MLGDYLSIHGQFSSRIDDESTVDFESSVLIIVDSFNYNRSPHMPAPRLISCGRNKGTLDKCIMIISHQISDHIKSSPLCVCNYIFIPKSSSAHTTIDT